MPLTFTLSIFFQLETRISEFKNERTENFVTLKVQPTNLCTIKSRLLSIIFQLYFSIDDQHQIFKYHFF